MVLCCPQLPPVNEEEKGNYTEREVTFYWVWVLAMVSGPSATLTGR